MFFQNHRKTPRSNWIDYDGGLFFITICTKDRVHYFGRVIDGVMQLSEIGKLVDEELSHPEYPHQAIAIPLYVVMPNHIHAIVDVKPIIADNPNGQRNPNPSQRPNPNMARHVPTLSKYVASLKSGISRQARAILPDFGWQPRYHDHLIRGNNDGNNIAEYIRNNPLNWNKDCFYG